MKFVFIFSLVEHETLKYGDYDFPDWADAVGWCLTALSVFHIPFWAIVAVCVQEGSTIKEKFFAALRPSNEWGPSDDFVREHYKNQLANRNRQNTASNITENDPSFKSLNDGSNNETGLEFL